MPAQEIIRMSVLDKVRKWIDGETSELVLEEAARDAQVKPRSQAEEFIVKIAREVEAVMQNEMVPLPQGTTIIPTEYTIFLSDTDDKNWQGVKRRGLEQGLYHILAERAKEIAGKKKLQTQSFAVQLRVDGTLEQGEIRVQHSWEDTNASKTSVLARMKPPAELLQNLESPARPVGQTPPVVRRNDPPPTMMPGAFPVVPSQGGSPATPVTNPDLQEEMTRVQKRNAEIYKLEIWRGGVRQNIVPVFQNQISIGRGSKSKPVDVALPGDPEISRRHLTLLADGRGHFSVVNEGRNPAVINGYELPMGQQISVSPGHSIAICSYLIRIQPR